ncbi:ATP-dependent zinc metalloprotease FtsH [Oceanirhabdus sp. W0125-5]|uniref:ATP-dependent zinc metalloprotease FtsH n=1 Tax=Oceanirhabdus sp. W0125-5 TaxID=2999116 RepID=UPI0022F2CFCF|nr:ATP-dependent zinc metalloprotease FtsH [Oceanirhabdus sp. W0125-5]WBW96158.1 ATP-dependent zinc metalloprotease FtsH [Oceanirhabdus sp. W0125-5]
MNHKPDEDKKRKTNREEKNASEKRNDKKGLKEKVTTHKFKFGIGYILIVFIILYLINNLIHSLTYEQVLYSKFETLGREGKIEEVRIASDRIYIFLKEEEKDKKVLYTERIPQDYSDLTVKLKELNIENYGAIREKENPLLIILLNWVVPLLVFMLLGRMILGSMQKKMSGGVMDFGKTKAKIYAERETGVGFKDVAGQEEAKESLREMVDFLNNPEKYREIGAKIPKGALLVGPPGTGKTLIAKAVAGEANVPFFSMSGSEFVQMFVGMGASKVRDLFKQAQEKAPCIVFIDEVDAIGKSRDSRISGGNDEREQTLNQLLTEMDGFDSSKGVVILAATNRPEVLDKALLRPGRFDRRVIMDTPDFKGRLQILKVHIKDVKAGEDIELEKIARITPGAVGADLANIINEGALLAVRNNRRFMTQEDLEQAVEEVLAGKIKKERILSKDEKEIVSYHEIGHALAAALLKNTDPVHKITIIPRTMGALGFTMQLPEEEKYLNSYDELMDKIVVLLAGRAAEEVIFNSITTGASNDIEKATDIARSSVAIYGMSEKFDMTQLEHVQGQYLHGSTVKRCSDRTEYEIDNEVVSIVKTQHARAVELIKKHKDVLSALAEILIEKETLTGEEFLNILKQYNLKV